MRRHSRSCSGRSSTLTAGSITAAMPPKASEPVTAYITANATTMWRTIWLAPLAAVTMRSI
jgi:hypothetical protein